MNSPITAVGIAVSALLIAEVPVHSNIPIKQNQGVGCIYINKATGMKLKIACRVITNGVGGDVIFIDEDRSGLKIRHDASNGWYSPIHRKDECLLRKQGLESICFGRAWDGI